VFTNGCFDILHKGHLEILTRSAEFGDILVVALNTDASVKNLKGDGRPVNNQDFRTWMMASLEIVDAVILFDEQTPAELIEAITPDIIVKGGDYTVDQVVGAKHVLSLGGEVKIVPIVKGYSTTGIIEAIQKL
jgi:D-beta-D-heptose 7-phosphate kinase/D-beta-D-heptose 1-phosphate adenosyltransferase